MSRVGRRPIPVPEGVTVDLQGQQLLARGPQGELSLVVHPFIKVSIQDGVLTVTEASTNRQARAFWGLTARLIANVLQGVAEGFTKSLELQGVGYRASLAGQKLTLAVGYSHPVEMTAPEGIEFKVEKNIIRITGINKQVVGETAAQIRKVRPPEPYKGKGIRYVGELVRRKAGKTAKAASAAA